MSSNTKVNTRSSSTCQLGSVKFKDVKCELETDPTTGSYRAQIPTGMDILGRHSYLTKQFKDGNRITRPLAAEIIADELVQLWIYRLNLYPKTKICIKENVIKIHQEKLDFTKTPKSRRTQDWERDFNSFVDRMKTGFDIKTPCHIREVELMQTYGVKSTREEQELYEDNCRQKCCSCSWEAKVKCPSCPRQIFAATKVCKTWQKRSDRQHKTKDNQEKKAKAASKEQESNTYINIDYAVNEIQEDESHK